MFFVRPFGREISLPVGVLIIDCLVAFSLFGVMRLARRIYLELIHSGYPRADRLWSSGPISNRSG